MSPEDIDALLRARPFVPFRVKLTTGDVYEIHHPELLMVGKRSVLIGVSADASIHFDRYVTAALVHVVSLEPPQP